MPTKLDTLERDQTPAAAGFAMPAEWEKHEATWIAWPHNRSDWRGKFAPIPWVYGEFVRRIAEGEVVRILVNDAAHETKARGVLGCAGAELSHIEFFRWPTNRGWARDFGPVFVRRERGGRLERAIVDFHFNAWAKYRNWAKDRAVAARAARALELPRFAAASGGGPFILEGGAIDVNGAGTVLTTEECLLDKHVQVRNAHLDRAGVEAALCEHLGVRQVVWLGDGIAGDDTHGHVDDICRFVNESTVLLCREDDSADVNYRALAENRERLQTVRLANGKKLTVVDLPMPRVVVFAGKRLPASYANFLIANAAVLVPTFNDVADRAALGILGELFTDRPVIGIHATDLVLGQGTLHCLTQQQPK